MRAIAAAALLTGTLLGATPQGLAAEDDPGIGAFVQRWEASSQAIRSYPDDKRRAAACRALMDEAFDFDVMAHDAFTDLWGRFTAGQRRTLVAALGRKAVSGCTDRIGDYGGGSFALLGIRVSDDGLRLVTAGVNTSDGQDLRVAWSLRRSGTSNWKAVDLSVNGRSMSVGFRREFDRVLANRPGNLAAAIRVMAAK